MSYKVYTQDSIQKAAYVETLISQFFISLFTLPIEFRLSNSKGNLLNSAGMMYSKEFLP